LYKNAVYKNIEYNREEGCLFVNYSSAYRIYLSSEWAGHFLFTRPGLIFKYIFIEKTNNKMKQLRDHVREKKTGWWLYRCTVTSNLNKLVILVWQNRRLSHFFCKVRFFSIFWEKNKSNRTWFPKRRIKINRSAQLLLLISFTFTFTATVRANSWEADFTLTESETERSMRFLYSQSINIFISTW